MVKCQGFQTDYQLMTATSWKSWSSNWGTWTKLAAPSKRVKGFMGNLC